MLGFARRSIDLIPTSWLITGAGAVLLGATALFGGLEAAAVEPTPHIAVGETFAGSDLEMTVRGVEVRADRGDLAVFPDVDKGERVLVVTVDAVNTFGSPRAATSLSTPSPVIDGILVDGIDEKANVSRVGEGTVSTWLQPDVLTHLELAWVIGPDGFRDGDEIDLTLPDSTHLVGSSVIRGDYWNDVTIGATLTATIDEVTAP